MSRYTNLQKFATGMFNLTKIFTPDIFSNAFTAINKLNYNLRHVWHFDVPLVNYGYNGTESILSMESKIWDILLNKITETKTVEVLQGDIIKIETGKLLV